MKKPVIEFARKFLTRFLSVAKLLKGVVARDGIEPPTPAFSGRLPNRVSGLKSMDVVDYNELTSAAP
jgi:hypothetical protein